MRGDIVAPTELEDTITPELALILSELPYTDWKREFGAVYAQKTSGKLYIYRALKKAEYSVLVESATPENFIDDLLQRCILYPFEIDKHLKSMTVSQVNDLADRIMATSAWGDIDQVLIKIDEERKNSEKDAFRFFDTMIMAYCGLKVKEIGELTIDQYARLVVLAESISQNGVPVAQPPVQRGAGRSRVPSEGIPR